MRAILCSIILFSVLAEGDDILAPDSKIEKIASGCKFTEGPVVDREGNLFFSDGPNDRIMRLSPDGKLMVERSPCGRVNGMTLDHEGRLVVCQSAGAGGKRRVSRFEKDGSETVLADQFDGKPFIAPNDLCIDHKGRIYFTDPYFGPPAEKSQPASGVYRIDTPGKVVRLLDNLGRPNGIVITADNKQIYVSDRATQKLHRYDVLDNGDLKAAGIVYDFSPDRGVDGMRLDVHGNIYAAAGQGKSTGLFVVSPQGKLLLHLAMPEFSTNVVFGGKDRRDLFITASTSVYKVRAKHAGAAVPAQR
jgi:gluconolactonase